MKLSPVIKMNIAVLMLAGCASEIDKCVDAGMKSAAIEFPDLNAAEKARLESDFRIRCLEANSGK